MLLDDSSRHRHGIQRRPRSEPTRIIAAASPTLSLKVVIHAPARERRLNRGMRPGRVKGILSGSVKAISALSYFFSVKAISAAEFFRPTAPLGGQGLIHTRRPNGERKNDPQEDGHDTPPEPPAFA